MEMVITCPECGTEFDVELPDIAPEEEVQAKARGRLRAKAQITGGEAVCPNCGAAILLELDDGDSDDEVVAAEDEDEAAEASDESDEEAASGSDEEPADPEQAKAFRRGVASGVRRERARLKALDALPALGCERMIVDAKYGKPRTAAALSKDMLTAVAQRQRAQFDTRKKAIGAAGSYKVTATPAASRGASALAEAKRASASIAKYANQGKGKKNV